MYHNSTTDITGPDQVGGSGGTRCSSSGQVANCNHRLIFKM